MKGKISALVLVILAAINFGRWHGNWHAGMFMGTLIGLVVGVGIRMYEDRNKT